MSHPVVPSPHRILVVDDNPAIHEDFQKILCPVQSLAHASVDSLMAEILDEAPRDTPVVGFAMDSAFQGQEALAKIRAAELTGNPYSLAFMDVRMPPGWDGVETIAHIWREYPHIQVVICTAYSDYSWEQILGQLGETDSLVILKKPFDNVEVLQLAHTLTKKWALTRQAGVRLADLDDRVRQRTQELTEANSLLEAEIQRRSLIESALRESEDRFHRAFETVPVALAIRPLDSGRYLDVNQCFAQLCGYSKGELLGRTPEELNLLAAPEAHAELLQALRAGKRVQNSPLALRHKDGQPRQTLASIELLKLGEQTCLLAALRDVTGQQELESQLRQAQKMEAVGQLAAGIAHDFNNLLTVIQGYASLQLAREALDADIAKAFTQVKLASERASHLTRQLLAFSRKQVVQRKPLDLAATVAKMQAMLSRVLGETIRLEYHNEPGLPPILADESNLEQVIMNLAVNARDAMPEGGTLSLTTGRGSVSAAQATGHPERREGDFAVLTVTDTGCGMDPQTVNRIFEPFFTTKPVGHGTGLGLSTVYGIVRQHEGWLEVESRRGAGTSFRIFLPGASAKVQPEADGVTRATPSAGLAWGPEDSILVVEDEADVREFVSSVLRQNGYHVVQANSGAEALLKWKTLERKVRLLVTDMVMPEGISGPALAHHLLRRQPGLKIIYTSGYSPEAVAHAELLKEGLNFLAKPFDRGRLLETVSQALATDTPAPQLPPKACSGSDFC